MVLQVWRMFTTTASTTMDGSTSQSIVNACLSVCAVVLKRSGKELSLHVLLSSLCWSCQIWPVRKVSSEGFHHLAKPTSLCSVFHVEQSCRAVAVGSALYSSSSWGVMGIAYGRVVCYSFTVQLSEAYPFYFAGPVQAELHIFLFAPGPPYSSWSSCLPGDETVWHWLDSIHHLSALQCYSTGTSSLQPLLHCLLLLFACLFDLVISKICKL